MHLIPYPRPPIPTCSQCRNQEFSFDDWKLKPCFWAAIVVYDKFNYFILPCHEGGYNAAWTYDQSKDFDRSRPLANRILNNKKDAQEFCGNYLGGLLIQNFIDDISNIINRLIPDEVFCEYCGTVHRCKLESF